MLDRLRGPGQTGTMNHSRNPRDLNLWAKAITDRVTSKDDAKKADISPPKDPAAVALGRKGGLKGGKARAEALSPKKRKEIAKKAAKARWEKD